MRLNASTGSSRRHAIRRLALAAGVCFVPGLGASLVGAAAASSAGRPRRAAVAARVAALDDWAAHGVSLLAGARGRVRALGLGTAGMGLNRDQSHTLTPSAFWTRRMAWIAARTGP